MNVEGIQCNAMLRISIAIKWKLHFWFPNWLLLCFFTKFFSPLWNFYVTDLNVIALPQKTQSKSYKPFKLESHLKNGISFSNVVDSSIHIRYAQYIECRLKNYYKKKLRFPNGPNIVNGKRTRRFEISTSMLRHNTQKGLYCTLTPLYVTTHPHIHSIVLVHTVNITF